MNFKKDEKDQKDAVYENGHLIYYMMAVRFAVIFIVLAVIFVVALGRVAGATYIIPIAVGVVALYAAFRCASYISLGNKCRALKKNK